VIAKVDLVEAEGTAATPVDHKHGTPCEGNDGITMWARLLLRLAAATSHNRRLLRNSSGVLQRDELIAESVSFGA